MKVNVEMGKLEKDMDYINMKINHSMMDSGKMIIQMGKAYFSIAMAICTLVISSTV